MPTLGDYLDTLAVRLMDLHVDDTAWAARILPGNRITYTGETGDEFPVKKSRAANDFPEAELEMVSTAPTGSAAQAIPKTFGNTSATAPPTCPWQFNNTHTFTMTYTMENQRSGLATFLQTATERILFNAGAKLSLDGSPLPWVGGWGPLSARHVKERASGTGAILSRKVVITIPVAITLTNADILG